MRAKILLLCLFLGITTFQATAKQFTFTTSDGVDLYVTVKGEGTPCLYIHGGFGAGSHFMEKFYGDTLERHFQMIYLDQRGSCRSGSSEDKDYSLARMLKDFEELRNFLKIDKWFTLGHSVGGTMQMAYALAHPEVQKGMIMMNCSLNFREAFGTSWIPKAYEFGDSTFAGMPREATKKQILMELDKAFEIVNAKGNFWKLSYKSVDTHIKMNNTIKEVEDWNFDLSQAGIMIDDYWQNFKRSTSSVSVPVLFIYGTRDYMIGPEHYKGVNFPCVLMFPIDGGHMPILENPAEAAHAIRMYLQTFFKG